VRGDRHRHYCGNQENIQNAYNLAGQRGPTDSDITRRFVFSGTWDLPFGGDKRFASPACPPRRPAAGR
jgi:hypothetical protein